MGLFDHILAGRKPPEPSVSARPPAADHPAAPRRFRPIETIQPHAVELPPPVDPKTLPFPDGDVIVPLHGLMDHIPAHLVRPGFVAADRPVIYKISELYTQILEGHVRISLLSLSQKCPALFRGPVAPADDHELPLSLELVVTQLPLFPSPVNEPVAKTPVVETPPIEASAIDTQVDELPVVETPAREAPPEPTDVAPEEAVEVEPAPDPVMAPPVIETVVEEDSFVPNAPHVLAPPSARRPMLSETFLPALPSGLPSPFDQETLQRIFQRREIFDALNVAHCLLLDGPARAVFLLIEDEDFTNGDVPEDLTPAFAFHLRRSFEQAFGTPLTQTHTLTLPDGEHFRSVWARGEIVLVAVHDHLQPPPRLAQLAPAVVDSLAQQHRCP